MVGLQPADRLILGANCSKVVILQVDEPEEKKTKM